MPIENEELLQKFVRTGMIMRHIDGEGPRCCKRGKHHKGHHGEDWHHGHGHGPDRMQAPAEEARFDFGPEDEMPKGPHGRPPHGHDEGGCGKRHGHRRQGQMRVIAMVALQEGISQKDLAFLLGIRPQTLGEMLQKLEGYGLVERKKSETDGRVIEVYLTDAGRQHAADFAERRKLMAADLFAVLTAEEKEQLSAILDKLGAELEKYRPKHHGHGHGHGMGASGERAENAEMPEPSHLA